MIDGPERQQEFDRQVAVLVLGTPQPIADAISDLVCHADCRLIRACEGSACTLMFLDGTKVHARRWCSIAVFSNRAKVAAHQVRASRKRD